MWMVMYVGWVMECVVVRMWIYGDVEGGVLGRLMLFWGCLRVYGEVFFGVCDIW